MLTRCSIFPYLLIISSCSASSINDAFSVEINLQRNPFRWIEKPVLPWTKATKKVVAQKPVVVQCLWKLHGISMGDQSSHAMLQLDGQMSVVKEKEAVDREWSVEKITNRCVMLRHRNGECRELTL